MADSRFIFANLIVLAALGPEGLRFDSGIPGRSSGFPLVCPAFPECDGSSGVIRTNRVEKRNTAAGTAPDSHRIPLRRRASARRLPWFAAAKLRIYLQIADFFCKEKSMFGEKMLINVFSQQGLRSNRGAQGLSKKRAEIEDNPNLIPV